MQKSVLIEVFPFYFSENLLPCIHLKCPSTWRVFLLLRLGLGGSIWLIDRQSKKSPILRPKQGKSKAPIVRMRALRFSEVLSPDYLKSVIRQFGFGVASTTDICCRQHAVASRPQLPVTLTIKMAGSDCGPAIRFSDGVTT